MAIVGTELSDGLEYWDVATGLMEPVLRTVGGGCTGGSVGTQIAVGDSSIEPVLLAVDGGSLGGSVGTRMSVGDSSIPDSVKPVGVGNTAVASSNVWFNGAGSTSAVDMLRSASRASTAVG